MNLCMSTLPNFDLETGLQLAREAGFHGVELRVHNDYHVSLNRLYHCARQIRELVDSYHLELSVFNTYFGVNDECAIDTLIRACRKSGVRFFRVVLPIAGEANVALQAKEGAVIPSYVDHTPIKSMLKQVRKKIERLETLALQAGVTAMVEIHWGTIMSSFSGAELLMKDIDPRGVALTFDPANMVIEGKEDWEFGIALLGSQFANLHVKNASWDRGQDDWQWSWSPLEEGLVDWSEIFQLLADYQYRGMVAMEDFRVPGTYGQALEHLRQLTLSTHRYQQMVKQSKVA